MLYGAYVFSVFSASNMRRPLLRAWYYLSGLVNPPLRTARIAETSLLSDLLEGEEAIELDDLDEVCIEGIYKGTMILHGFVQLKLHGGL